MRYCLTAVASLAITLFATGSSLAADTYPDHAIHIITSGIGGPSDVMARIIASGITGPLGQPVVVDNRVPLIAYDTVAKSVPDGYTIYLAGAYFTTLKLLQTNVSPDPVTDFAPITETDAAPCIFVVNPTLPATSLKELIDLAKSKPGQLNFATGPLGVAADLGARLFESVAKLNIVNIAYKTTPEANLSVMSGYAQMTMDAIPSLSADIQAGKLRALAVTTPQPSQFAPGVPTMAAAGLPGFDMTVFGGVYAPARTPPAIIARLNHEIVLVLHQPDVAAKIAKYGTQVVGSSPDELGQVVKADVAKWSKVINAAGIAHQ